MELIIGLLAGAGFAILLELAIYLGIKIYKEINE